MKKILALVMAIMMMVVAAGCGGGNEKSSGSGSAAGGEKKITMGFSQIGAESEWRTANTESVKQAAKEANAHDFIKRLPMQYQTYLQEAGNGLSGGEKQRIALARAFLKKSNFYILDESTSNLDFATENTIFDMIYNKFRNKSMLIIAHRLATVKNCDQILVMDKGEIVERGTHEELLDKGGKYKLLWEMQQGNFITKDEEPSKQETVKEIIEDDDDTLVYT